MLEEHRWGLAIPVSQIACEGPFQNPLGVGCLGRTSGEALRASTPQLPKSDTLKFHFFI
jgi:hypothetical protein